MFKEWNDGRKINKLQGDNYTSFAKLFSPNISVSIDEKVCCGHGSKQIIIPID